MLKYFADLLKDEAKRLHQESIIFRTFGRLRVRGRCLFDDRVRALQGRPLGMFFYNQRAIFLGCGAVALIGLGAALAALPHTPEMTLTALVLAAFWVADAAATLLLHRSFIRKLDVWSRLKTPTEFPPLFDRYFLIDSFFVLLLVLTGRLLHLGLDAFIFLLFANLVVYSAYINGAPEANPRARAAFEIILAAQFALILPFSLNVSIGAGAPRWFYAPLYILPMLSMLLVTVFSVSMVSRLRTIEHEITIRRFKLAGDFEAALSTEMPTKPAGKAGYGRTEAARRQFERQVQRALKDLCSLPPPFWYRSACLWYAERRKDPESDQGYRELLLPGPSYNFKEADEHRDGISDSEGLLGSPEIVLLHSVKCRLEEGQDKSFNLRGHLDAPAAFIPLRDENRARAGVLALYGEEGGPPLQRQDLEFLKLLRSILSNTIEQWDSRYRAVAQREMDELFQLGNLTQVFKQAARIMQKYLSADGCMILFRPDPNADEMHVIAREGFGPSIYEKNLYVVGTGQTGLCAKNRQVIRWDDVPRHREVFDPKSLSEMERAHGKPILSWMAIPIGTRKNYGVIKVVNRNTRCSWFTDEDEQLGKSLAFRLFIIIEKFLYVERMVKATKDAEDQSAEAQRQSKIAQDEELKALETARQRQEDLMIITHQLQGPLSALLGTVSYLQTKQVSQLVQEGLADLEALVEDGLALCYGTFTTFALGAGRKIPFGMENIEAPVEMERLCARLQKNEDRNDLTIIHHEEPGFPILRMDRNVFTSVLYSLIHNAMKYADPNSEVSLVCGFERSTGEPTLKVKSWGEPIGLSEAGKIFEKFGRGQVHARTGRHHSGVGLGLWVARGLMLAVGGNLTVELSVKHPRLSVFVIHAPKKKPGGDGER
jgi:signal transduction histidine kinase